MWKFILLILAGAVSGVLGGMGMGGGTILIPVLTVFFKVGQKSAQAINLVAFVPMAVVSLIIHAKNGRIKKKDIGYIVIPAMLFSVGGSLIASLLDNGVLQKVFGGFLLLLSVVQFFSDKISKFLDERQDIGNADDKPIQDIVKKE